MFTHAGGIRRRGAWGSRLGGLQPFSAATRRVCCARWTSRRRQRLSPCWTRSTSCAATAARRGPPGFLRPNSRWRRLLRTQSDHRLWETAVLFHLRDAFRAGGVWLARSRRYGDIRKALLSTPAGADADRSLPVPASPHDWLNQASAGHGRIQKGDTGSSCEVRRVSNRRAEFHNQGPRLWARLCRLPESGPGDRTAGFPRRLPGKARPGDLVAAGPRHPRR